MAKESGVLACRRDNSQLHPIPSTTDRQSLTLGGVCHQSTVGDASRIQFHNEPTLPAYETKPTFAQHQLRIKSANNAVLEAKIHYTSFPVASA